MAHRFPYLREWRVVLCEECGFCLRPGSNARDRHLRQAPHNLAGPERRALVEMLGSHDVWAPPKEEPPRWPTHIVPGLRVHDGFRCLMCDSDEYLTRSLKDIGRHASKKHGQKPAAHQRKGAPPLSPPWEACKLQTFFAETRLIRYFVVVGSEAEGSSGSSGKVLVDDTAAVEAFFRLLEEDAAAATEDARADANLVHGFDSHRSAVVPWLRRTGIADHIEGLDKDEMQSSFAVPGGDRVGGDGAGDDDDDDGGPELRLILKGMDELLTEAHRWCFDGPECRLTWPRQLALSRFRTADGVGGQRLRGFDPKKEPATVERNFRYWKQCVVFYVRVVHRGRHFTEHEGGEGGPQTPEGCIRPTEAQAGAWRLVWDSAVEADQAALGEALLAFSMALICHEFGGYRYRSALLSFAAMHSVERKTKAWRPAGNFSSFLSGLIWVAQLIVFRASVGGAGRAVAVVAPSSSFADNDGDATGDGDGDDDGGAILERINGHCQRYMRPDTETPIGEILGWRLLLKAVAREEVGPHQATWDEDEQALTYGDVTLHLSHVRKLFATEVERARRLLYGELMFGAASLPRLQASALEDDLSKNDVGWFFGQHRRNQGVLGRLARALEGVIKSSEPLRNAFLDGRQTQTLGSSGVAEVTWRAKAIAHYEAVADEFLTTYVTLFQMTSGQPLREAELFSILWRNTQRHRSIGLKHGRVMVHVTYHKGQQQTGRVKDNIRFLHEAIGDPLVNYIIYVLPLRQAFLRYSTPGAIISPYLWSSGGDGRVWGDNRLTRCMEKACARAEVPRLHIANWRQMTVSIVKTKFGKEAARYFDVSSEGGGGGNNNGDDEDVADEEIDDDIRAITRQRNHGTRTANRAYSNQAGASFGSVWDGLVRRGLRASTLWHELWGLDTLLALSPPPPPPSLLSTKKRMRSREGEEIGMGPSNSLQIVKRIAMGTYRQGEKKGKKDAWSSAALLEGARRLYQDNRLQWKSAAQERAMMTVMSRSEQVVVVLATGEGKSLLFMLPCVLPDAGVTILILPLVSLRGDLLRRVRQMGIEHHVWSQEEPEPAASTLLVFVTVEAAATSHFRGFAARLAAKQELARIVVDEAHLTVTASRYRQAMVDLALLRMVRTQFVYLTATLPPSMQGRFEEQNHLVRPKVVRASTNRRNLSYLVQVPSHEEGEGGSQGGARTATAASRA